MGLAAIVSLPREGEVVELGKVFAGMLSRGFGVLRSWAAHRPRSLREAGENFPESLLLRLSIAMRPTTYAALLSVPDRM